MTAYGFYPMVLLAFALYAPLHVTFAHTELSVVAVQASDGDDLDVYTPLNGKINQTATSSYSEFTYNVLYREYYSTNITSSGGI